MLRLISRQAKKTHNRLTTDAAPPRRLAGALNLIAGRPGLDHDRVFFGRYALPVMVHYLDRRGGRITDPEEQDRLLYWFVQSAMWGRYSGSTESVIDKDLRAVEALDSGLDRLIAELRVWRGDLRVVPDHFQESTIGTRFYPVLYMLTRVGEARTSAFTRFDPPTLTRSDPPVGSSGSRQPEDLVRLDRGSWIWIVWIVLDPARRQLSSEQCAYLCG